MRNKIRCIWLMVTLVFAGSEMAMAQSRVILLRWEDVIDRSLEDNLALKSTFLDHRYQRLNTRQALSSFLPTVSYQGLATNNLELPVMTLMGQKFRIGTEYNFQHSLQVSLPLFTGFSRLSNLNMQRSLEKSLKAELKVKEDETVLAALEAYFQVMLGRELIQVGQDAVDAAKANLGQVWQFHQVGAASELDLKRAEARYSSTIPALESARNQARVSQNQLKVILDLSLDDSLVVQDSLHQRQFMGMYADLPLARLKDTAMEDRPELKQAACQIDMAKNQKRLALSGALPTVALTAGMSYLAMTEDYHLSAQDYNRSKSINLVVEWPLFQGGKTALECQKAQVRIQQTEYAQQMTSDQILLDVEQSYFALGEAEKNLESLKASLEQTEEALRLANLLYAEGMSTQVDVLNAQLSYTLSHIGYLRGLYQYNVGQLNLLKSIGHIDAILN